MRINYEEVMAICKDYIDTFNTLYRLKTNDESQINRIYNDIKNNLIETKAFLPSKILEIISVASIFNNRFLKSYWTIFKKIYEEYQPAQIPSLAIHFGYFFYKEYGIVLDLSLIHI